ncbi:hypothetical protein FACS1894206_04310 [Deltaproteobacteria bacterium]|nr:hypothetical protein FACS1894206_04310 [Deltaproteobacteria bacterium]
MPQSTQSNMIRLTQPAAGQTVTVPVDANDMKMALGFASDPNMVNMEGNNLTFSFDDGGKIVLEGYYDHFADKTLPTMVMESGDELAGEDFLASLKEDLLTAAGPGAGAGAAGSGSGEYADDPGALIDGVNRLGSLGTIFWDRATEPTEAYAGEPGSGISIGWLNPPFGGGEDWSAAQVNGGRFIFQESALPGGTRDINGPVSASSTIHVNTVNSAFTGMTINDVYYSLAQLTSGVTIGLDLDGDGSPDVTVVFQYEGSNNVSVNVTLDNAVSHMDDLGNALDEAMAGMGLTAHDSRGNSAAGSVEVVVVDDNPEAFDDSQTMQVEDSDGNNIGGSISGSVVTGAGKDAQGNDVTTGTADMAGADGLGSDPVSWDTGNVSTGNTAQAGHEDQDMNTAFHLEGSGPTYTVMDGGKVVGEITLNPDGSYEFTVNPQYEPEHGDHTINIPYTVTDADGDSANANLQITIQNQNDRPVITGGTGGEVKETGVYAPGERTDQLNPAENAGTTPGGIADGQHQLSVTGQLTATDADGDKLRYGAGQPGVNQTVTNNPDGSYTIHDPMGDLTINPDGSWHFALNDGAANHLGEGKSENINFPVSVTDNANAANSTGNGSITITVRGTNDEPKLSLEDKNLSIVEGVDTTVNTKVEGQAAAKDADDNANLRFGLEGPDGHVVDKLYVVPDGQGGYTLSETAPVGGNYYGTFTIDANGKYTFEVNNSADCVQKLQDVENGGKNPHFDITVVVQDEHGAYDKGSLGVDITGRNDSPVITGGNKGAVKEDGVYGAGERVNTGGILKDGDPSAIDENAAVKEGGIGKDQHQNETSGKLTASDVDDPTSSLTFGPKDPGAANVTNNPDGSYTIQGKYGDLTIKPDGSWTYKLDEDKAQSLTEGQKVTENFPVSVKDPHGGTGNGNISIDVHGTNDTPSINESNVSIGFKEDDGSFVTGGKFTATDPDKGESGDLRFGIEASDGSVQQTVYVVPDGKGGFIYQANAPAGGDYYARVTMNPDGTYKVEMNNNANCVQSLGDGESANINVTVVVQDPRGAYDKENLNVVINGSDDKASIDMDALNPSQTVIEAGVKPGGNIDYAGKPTATGTIHAADPDAKDEIHYFVTDKNNVDHELGDTSDPAYDPSTGTWTIDTDHGSVTFTDNGKGGYDYEYTLNNNDPDVNALDRQEKMGDGFPVRVENQDGESVDANVKITIVGTNDRPLIVDNVINVGLHGPDNAIDGSFAGRISVSDVDKGHHGNTAAEQAEGSYNLVVTGAGGKNFVPVYDAAGKEIGTAEISPDGSYKITLNDLGKQELQAKAEGEHLEVHTPIRVTDPDGAYSETDVTWRLEGEDDAPRLSNSSVGMHEDGWNAGRPVILVPDPNDPSKSILVANPNYSKDDRPDTISGKLGASAVDKTDTGADQFDYSLKGDTDGDGIMYVLPNGSVTDTAPPAGSDYIGTVTLDPNGNWTFTLNQNSGTVNALRPGQNINVNVPVEVEDGRGYTTGGSINITVNGTNDRPSIEKAPDLSLNQSRGPNGEALHDHDSYVVGGRAEASDPDNVAYRPDGSANLGGGTVNAAGSEITFCFIDPVTGQPTQTLQLEHGTVTIDAKTGEYTYTYNVFDDSNYTNGKSGEQSDSFTIYARDKNGAYSNPEDVTVKIDDHDQWGGGPGGPGSNLTVDGSDFTVREDNGDVRGKGDASVSGPGNGGHVEGGSGYFFLDSVTGKPVQSVPAFDTDGNRVGSYILDPISGEYTFVLDNGSDFVQRMDGIDTITVRPPTVHDVNGGTVDLPTCTVQGTADAPEFSQNDYYGRVQEGVAQNGGDSVSGKLAASDLDKGDNDHLSFEPGAPRQGQNAVDNGDGTYTISGKYGDLTINSATGEWTYTVWDNENVPHGDHSEDFNVKVWDDGIDGRGTGKLSDDATIHINVNGLNTAPVYNGVNPTPIEVKEDNINSADGKYVVGGGKIDLNAFADADGDKVSLSVAPDKNGDGHADRGGQAYAVGEYGTLFIKPDGSYEYRLNNNMGAVQGLKDGEYIEDHFVVIADDGYGGKVEIPVNVKVEGTNDNPVLSLNDASGTQYGGGVSLDMVEGQISVGGKAVATDADASDTTFTFGFKDGNGNVVDKVNAYADIDVDGDGVPDHVIVGEFVIDPNSGAYKFIPNGNLDHLKGGEQISVKAEVVVESSDGTGKTGGTASSEVTVNITGTNDAPIMTPVIIQMQEGSGTYTATGNLASVTVDPDAAPGDKGPQFSVKTGSGVTQTGPNTWEGQYGTLTLNPDGTYTYAMHNDKAQSLAEGEHAEDEFTVVVRDQYGASSNSKVTVDIEGTNDAPVLNNITAANVREGGSAGGSFHATDVDHNAGLTYSVKGAVEDDSRAGFDHKATGPHGDLYYNSETGAYEYVANNAESLSQGEKAKDQFEVTVTDEHGASDSKGLDVNLTGTNQAPVLDPITSGSTTEGGSYVNGKFNATDVDIKDARTYSVDGAVTNTDTAGHGGFDKVVHGDHGDLYYNSSTGQYQYEAGRGLGKDKTGEEDFTVRVSDGHGGSDNTGLHIDVIGANDAPTLNAMTTSVAENSSVTGQFAGADVDAGDVLTYAVAGAVADSSHPGFDSVASGRHGNLYYNSATGAYQYETNGSKSMGAGESAQESFNVTVSDQHGAKAGNSLDVTLHGVNDAPTIQDVNQVLNTDAGHSASVSGQIIFGDVDVNDTISLFVTGPNGMEEISAKGTIIHGQYGNLTVNPDGTYSYEVTDMSALANAGSGGLKESFTTSVNDGHNPLGGVEGAFDITITHNSVGVVGDAIVGTAGDDTIRSGAGDSIIYGGAGSDVLYGDGGSNSFVWGVGDITHGSLDTVMDFSMDGKDQLSFDSLFEVKGSYDHENAKLVLQVSDPANGSAQTVEVNFVNDSSHQQFVNDYAQAGPSQQAELVEQMIKSITGS